MTASPFDQDLQHRVALFVQQRQLTLGAKITISARRGVVTLKGTTKTFHQRQLLIAFASKVAGVVRVNDELEVELVPSRSVSTPAKAYNERSTVQRIVPAALLSLALAALLAGCSRSGPPRVPTH